ncbi:unnamed protein product [Ilex paraguariensis]|uniref:ZF-HD dimerization-type domain-containing protein n=1 Tax=Ilex paraguariensis TaxID=185542 RepID=A0ABC8TFN8_9AQUA
MATNNNAAAERVRYKECRRNHAAHLGRHAIDGCSEFSKSGNDGTPEALLCAACGCHRNFHRKEEQPLSRRQELRLYLFRHLSAAAAAGPPPPPRPPPPGALDHARPNDVRSQRFGEGEIEDGTET